MSPFRSGAFLVLVAAVFGAGTSCTTRPSLVREQLGFSLPPAPVPAPASGKVLAVPLPQVAAAFDRVALVYRTGENTYETDPYAQFLAAPRELLGEAFRAHFQASGLFREVRRTVEGADVVARLTVTEMFGDFRGPDTRTAHLALQVAVSSGPSSAPPLFVKAYGRDIAISRRRADVLVGGLGQAVADIASEIAADLRRAGTAP